jgi:hypothetical protein
MLWFFLNWSIDYQIKNLNTYFGRITSWIYDLILFAGFSKLISKSFLYFRKKMETLKEIAHISDFSIFKILARDLTLQVCFKMKLDNASS